MNSRKNSIISFYYNLKHRQTFLPDPVPGRDLISQFTNGIRTIPCPEVTFVDVEHTSGKQILGWDRPKHSLFSFSFCAAVVTQLQLWRLPCLVSVHSVGHLWDRPKYPRLNFSFSTSVVTQLQLWRLSCLVSVNSMGLL